MFLLPGNCSGLLVQRAVVLLSILPASLTDAPLGTWKSALPNGTGGEIAAGKVNAEHKMTTAFEMTKLQSQTDQPNSLHRLHRSPNSTIDSVRWQSHSSFFVLSVQSAHALVWAPLGCSY